MTSKQLTLTTLIAVLALTLGGVAMATEPVPLPDFDPGDAADSCAQVGAYVYAYKIDGWDEGSKNGTYEATFDDGHFNNITILNSDGTYFDWSASPNPIGAVIVKGGDAANVFYYDPQASSDTGLYSPLNQGEQQAEVSHVVFCWNPEFEIVYEYETAFAFGGDTEDCFLNNGFDRWGWSNGPIGPGTYSWPLYAGAGRCDLTKGAMVGHATVIYDGYVTVDIELLDGLLLDETHVYAGYDMFPPFKGKYTVAPGQYTNDGPFAGDIYVIVHAVVGIPVMVP